MGGTWFQEKCNSWTTFKKYKYIFLKIIKKAVYCIYLCWMLNAMNTASASRFSW
jgi:hypothetical protein